MAPWNDAPVIPTFKKSRKLPWSAVGGVVLVLCCAAVTAKASTVAPRQGSSSQLVMARIMDFSSSDVARAIRWPIAGFSVGWALCFGSSSGMHDGMMAKFEFEIVQITEAARFVNHSCGQSVGESIQHTTQIASLVTDKTVAKN